MYEVIVGNVGTVYEGDDETEAVKEFMEYVEISQSSRGRAGDEEVTLLDDGEPIKEYVPGIRREENPNRTFVESWADVLDFVYEDILEGFAAEELGDVQDFGWYGLLIYKPKIFVGEDRTHFAGAILHEDNYGNKDVDTFKTEKEAREAWSELEDEYDEFMEEGEDDEEENPLPPKNRPFEAWSVDDILQLDQLGAMTRQELKDFDGDDILGGRHGIWGKLTNSAQDVISSVVGDYTGKPVRQQ